MEWKCAIACLIDLSLVVSVVGNAFLESGGGYSIKLSGWSFVSFPMKVVPCIIKRLKNNKSKNLISVNVLGFLIDITNYCAKLTMVLIEHVTQSS
jgi:hypothetical protein